MGSEISHVWYRRTESRARSSPGQGLWAGQQLGAVLPEQRLHPLEGGVTLGVQLLDQAQRVRRHDYQVSSWARPGVPERVANTTRSQDCRTGRRFHLPVTEAELSGSPLEHIPGLVFVMVHMRRGDQLRCPYRAASGAATVSAMPRPGLGWTCHLDLVPVGVILDAERFDCLTLASKRRT